MLVREIMTADLVTVEGDASLEEAARGMLDRRAGSAIVVEDGTPVGIVTESDVLRAGCREGVPLSEIPVAEAMSRPLVTIAPDATVRAALERMDEEGVKKLPVLDDLELVGIATTTDVARHQPEAVKRAHELERRREGWEG